MPRSKLPTRRQVHLRIPEEVFANLILLRPELVDPTGQIRYGAMNGYFIKLVQLDIEERISRLSKDRQAFRELKDEYFARKREAGDG